MSVPPRVQPSSAGHVNTKKAAAIAGVLVVALAAGLWLWRSGKQAGAAPAARAPSDVVAVELAAVAAPLRLLALGEVRAIQQVTLASEAGGRVAALSFEPGQRVKAGTLLVQLDDRIEQADLAAAQASAAFAMQQYKRAQVLGRSGAVSREVLQQRQAEHEQSAAQVQQLQARIRQKRIHAPFDGVLGLRWVDLGQYVNAGEAAVSLTNLDRLYINFNVPQQQLGQLQVGQSVEVRSDAPGAETLLAQISAIEPQVARDTRNATVQATLDNHHWQLRPGMSVATAVVLPAEADALLLPAAAVMASASGDLAAVVREISSERVGKVEFVPIQVGRRIGDQVVVRQGLGVGDVVVTEGQIRLRQGASVHVLAEQPAPTPVAGR